MTSKIAAFGAMLQRRLSRDGDRDSIQSIERRHSMSSSTVGIGGGSENGAWSNADHYAAPIMQDNSRSRERGRELFSTGRGGAGNIHRSQSRDAVAVSPEQFANIKRGREPVPSPTTHVGRGGAGNFIDPARPLDSSIDPIQAKREQEFRDQRAESVQMTYSTGRGGAGNITSSSRSRSRDPPTEAIERSQSRGRNMYSTGRGGAGNVIIDGIAEEDERVKYLQTHEQPQGVHSTGRGGLANLTSGGNPGVEPSPVRHDGPLSTGRGGAGNITSRDPTRSASRGRRGDSRGPDPAAEHQHGIGKIMDRMKGKTQHDKHEG